MSLSIHRRSEIPPLFERTRIYAATRGRGYPPFIGGPREARLARNIKGGPARETDRPSSRLIHWPCCVRVSIQDPTERAALLACWPPLKRRPLSLCDGQMDAWIFHGAETGKFPSPSVHPTSSFNFTPTQTFGNEVQCSREEEVGLTGHTDISDTVCIHWSCTPSE